MIAGWLKARKSKTAAYLLYHTLVTQARNSVFYTELGVDDTVDGRFDMILLHIFIVMHRLRGEGGATEGLARALQEVMIDDMDRNLREMGVGDMSVGKHVKDMGTAWFGRDKAYGEALQSDDPVAALEDVVHRNVFRGDTRKSAEPIANYIVRSVDVLAHSPVQALAKGNIIFPAVVK